MAETVSYTLCMAIVYTSHAIRETPALAGNGNEGRPTETLRVYAALKHAILAGSYQPGESLQETRLAAEYGASRTPVREALLRLESDGLLTIAPRRGAFVQQPTLRDFLDVNELRLLLDRAAETVDLIARQELYRRAYRSIYEDAPWLFLYSPRFSWAAVTGIAWTSRHGGIVGLT
jgi:DNA-binding GntR family transcriptional regulator